MSRDALMVYSHMYILPVSGKVYSFLARNQFKQSSKRSATLLIQKEKMMVDEGRENREFERYPAKLEVQVVAFDASGKQFTETGVLQNISGGGANFLAGEPEKFYIGQKVDLKICLPFTDELGTSMKGHGMVVWVGEDENPEDHSKRASIGLCLDDLLSFEHLIQNSE